MSDSQIPIRYVNPATGREVIFYPPPSLQPLPLPPMSYPVPAPYEYPYPVPPPPHAAPPAYRANARRGGGSAECKGRLAGGFFGWFIVSWTPCAFGLPGLTLLAWGLGAAYLLYRAVKGA